MSGWIEYKEGDSKPEDGVRFDVKFRDGTVMCNAVMNAIMPADSDRSYGTTWVYWDHDDAPNDIVAYRVIQTESAPLATPYEPTVPNVNPKEAIGSTKIPMHLASPLATAYMAVGLANGALKYGTANFKATPVLASIYLDGLLRHTKAWIEGEECDPDDGVPNLAGALANLAIIIEARANGTLIDDRPIGDGYLKEREMLTEVYRNLKKLHAGKQPHHFTRNNA